MRVGGEHRARDLAILRVDRNFSWLNEMSSNAGAEHGVGPELDGDGDRGVRAGPAEPREAVALPVLAEPGRVRDVVGAELPQGGAGPAAGDRGQQRSQRGDRPRDEGVLGAGREPAAAGGDGYRVTSTAA